MDILDVTGARSPKDVKLDRELAKVAEVHRDPSMSQFVAALRKQHAT